MLIRIWIQVFDGTSFGPKFLVITNGKNFVNKNHSFVSNVPSCAFSVNAVLQEIIEAETSSSAVLSFPYSIHQPINEEGDKEPLVGEGTI